MRRLFILAALIMSLSLVTTIGYFVFFHKFFCHKYENYSNDKMDKFYTDGGFNEYLQLAINGNKSDRINYYRIAVRFPLDGCYSEDFQEGLDLIAQKHGRELVVDEMAGLKDPKVNYWIRGSHE